MLTAFTKLDRSRLLVWTLVILTITALVSMGFPRQSWCQGNLPENAPMDSIKDPADSIQIFRHFRLKLKNGSSLKGQSSKEEMLRAIAGSGLTVTSIHGDTTVDISDIDHIRWFRSARGPLTGAAIGAITGALIGAVSFAATQEPAGTPGLQEADPSAAGLIAGWSLGLAAVGAIAGNATASRKFPIHGQHLAFQKAVKQMYQ